MHFIENPRGTLISMEPEEFSGNIYNVWFPYARSYVNYVKEGSFIAIRNFASNSERRSFCVLEIISALPVHYALGSSPADTERSFPGFVIEAAHSARQDWEQEEPIEQTTKIKVEAISTGLQLVFNQSTTEPSIENDMSLPMIGEEALLLTTDMISEIVNRGLMNPEVPTISPCSLVLHPTVDVKLHVDELLRTHSGIFGFTGSGKSNLMSNMINSLLNCRQENIKVVLFDLMAEYTALTIDMLNTMDQAYILVIGEDSLPGGDVTRDYLNGNFAREEEAAISIVRTLLLPKELVPYRNRFVPIIRNLLRNSKVKIYDPGGSITVREMRTRLEGRISGNPGNQRAFIEMWLETNFSAEDTHEVTGEHLSAMADEISRVLANGMPQQTLERTQTPSQRSLGGGATSATSATPLNATARMIFSSFQREIRLILDRPEGLPENSMLTLSQIREMFDSNEKVMIIVQCNRDDELRETSAHFVNYIFDRRRRLGIVHPTILFAYDEADEFMPSEGGNQSYAQSKSAVTTLARRGRKFGLGLTLATQRVAYLDTSIMAQPHTYFISKLPRKYDREAMANAFGVTDDMMKKTLRFSKGQWLLVSFDATGLENVPVPVQFPNANRRIVDYVQSTQIVSDDQR